MVRLPERARRGRGSTPARPLVRSPDLRLLASPESTHLPVLRCLLGHYHASLWSGRARNRREPAVSISVTGKKTAPKPCLPSAWKSGETGIISFRVFPLFIANSRRPAVPERGLKPATTLGMHSPPQRGGECGLTCNSFTPSSARVGFFSPPILPLNLAFLYRGGRPDAETPTFFSERT